MQRSGRLTSRQQLVLNFVNDAVRDTGAPPTVREVMRRCGLSSPRGAQLQLKALVKCGLLVHEPGTKRGYRPKLERPASVVPIMGSAPAGHPLDQPEDHQGSLPLPWGVPDGAFAVRVIGDSMKDAHVLPGDLVVVDREREPKDGDVVLARVDDEQMIKRLRKDGRTWRLESANEEFGPVEPKFDGDHVVGCVIALVRRVG